jgi:hypothetical protein
MFDEKEWQELCRQVAQETNREKLLELTKRISEILLERLEELRRRYPRKKGGRFRVTQDGITETTDTFRGVPGKAKKSE